MSNLIRNKSIAACLLIICLASGSTALTTLYRVRFGYYPDKIRTVFDFDGAFTYYTDESPDKIVLRIKQVQASPAISNYVEINDLIVRYLQIERDGQDIVATIPIFEPVDYNIFYLNDPPRLVVDFGREYLNIVSGGTIANGVEFLRARKGIRDGHIDASVLKIDLDQASIRPALAQKRKSTIIESLVNLVTPWLPKQLPRRFYLDKVSSIVAQQRALAGVNGTYYAGNGRPLGALMIDQELVSFSIHDRTAFFLDEAGQPYIDNIFITSHFKTAEGARYKISGINQRRGVNDIIMYTSIWGERTGTNSNGIELTVIGSEIRAINVADSWIPENGYVLSISGPAVEVLAGNIKVGDLITTSLSVVPYNTSPEKIVHLISGGPRLLKAGRTYVSKHEERFKSDIARGRAARTAIGITKQGELVLVTVDGPPKGRQLGTPASLGVTLEELSALMASLGAYDAMNLDGGSSSTMVVDGRVANKPNGGHQRRVSNALVVNPAGAKSPRAENRQSRP